MLYGVAVLPQKPAGDGEIDARADKEPQTFVVREHANLVGLAASFQLKQIIFVACGGVDLAFEQRV